MKGWWLSTGLSIVGLAVFLEAAHLSFLAVHFKYQLELFTHFVNAWEKHMNNAVALGGRCRP